MPTSFSLLLRSLRRYGDELAAGLFALLWLTGVVSGPIPNGHWDLTRPLSTSERPQRLQDLTNREIDVLVALSRGLSNAEIADELHLSTATIKTHVARVLAKLGVRDRVQAVIAAYETGLVHRHG